jgi:phage regulator Rha-like protein
MKKINTKETKILPVAPPLVEQKIHVIRGQKVMLDKDLAELYQILTRNLNKAVKRNIERFPEDFMFQLDVKEEGSLKFQIGTSKVGRGGRRKPTHAFTELGVAMLSSVLNSDRAVQVNIYIMRAFVKLREIMATNKEVSGKITKLEEGQKENREDIDMVTATLKLLMEGDKQ